MACIISAFALIQSLTGCAATPKQPSSPGGEEAQGKIDQRYMIVDGKTPMPAAITEVEADAIADAFLAALDRVEQDTRKRRIRDRASNRAMPTCADHKREILPMCGATWTAQFPASTTARCHLLSVR